MILYQRDHCHLCDLALDVLANARIPEFETVFIDDDEALEVRYGLRYRCCATQRGMSNSIGRSMRMRCTDSCACRSGPCPRPAVSTA